MAGSKQSRSNHKRTKAKRSGSTTNRSGDTWTDDLFARMESSPDAESLNDQIIRPFMQTLVEVCNARGYVFNIYGEHSNLAITPEHHAEAIYRLVDAYLDEAGL